MANTYTQEVCNNEKGYHVWKKTDTICQCAKMVWALDPYAYPAIVEDEKQDDGVAAIYRRLGKD